MDHKVVNSGGWIKNRFLTPGVSCLVAIAASPAFVAFVTFVFIFGYADMAANRIFVCLFYVVARFGLLWLVVEDIADEDSR